MKHTYEEKLNYVRLALTGEPQSQICRRFKLGQHYLETLIDRYKLYGETGLRRKSYNPKYVP
ncbi:MAG: helix-turn-helix domain containing protein [Muribaculaceae bacterium]|nr:helix-turn-helix domain containing protein [Muribaculaceae bacterium]MDE6809901.1 helix-turn-helix domain containing protein [Muribaculaceae bacterium]